MLVGNFDPQFPHAVLSQPTSSLEAEEAIQETAQIANTACIEFS